MPSFLDAVYFLATSAGTVDFVPASAVQGYRNLSTANGAVDGRTYAYRAESASLNEWEIGIGTWSSGTSTLVRTTVLYNSAGTTAKINFAAAPNVGIVETVQDMLGVDFANSFTSTQKAQIQSNIGVREVLVAARTYYVRTDGSDSNTGLINSAGGAFLTIAKALSVAASLDCSIYQLMISIGAGTYTGVITLPSLQGSLGGILTGAGATTILSGGIYAVGGNCAWTIEQIKVESTIGNCVDASSGARLQLGIVEYGAAIGLNHVNATANGYVNFMSVNYTISGGASAHMRAATGGIIEGFLFTVTMSGSPAFANFCFAYNMGSIYIQSATYGAGATGTRYQGNYNSLINSGGGGANYFGGNAAGLVANSSYYI